MKKVEYFFGRSEQQYSPESAVSAAVMLRDSFLINNKEAIEEISDERMHLEPLFQDRSHYCCIITLIYFTKI